MVYTYLFLIITENNGTIENLDSKMMVEVPCRVGINENRLTSGKSILIF
ncbi:hypothetical protein [Clostridium pasteurianum]